MTKYHVADSPDDIRARSAGADGIACSPDGEHIAFMVETAHGWLSIHADALAVQHVLNEAQKLMGEPQE